MGLSGSWFCNCVVSSVRNVLKFPERFCIAPAASAITCSFSDPDIQPAGCGAARGEWEGTLSLGRLDRIARWGAARIARRAPVSALLPLEREIERIVR